MASSATGTRHARTAEPVVDKAWTRSLRFRLTVRFTGALACVMITAGVVLYVLAQRAILAETDSFLGLEIRRLASVVLDPGHDADDVTEALEVDKGAPLRSERFPGLLLFPVVYARFVDAETGKTIIASPSLARDPEMGKSLDAWHVPPTGSRQVRFDYVGPDEEDTMRAAAEWIMPRPAKRRVPNSPDPALLDNRLSILEVCVPWDANEDILERAGLFMTGATALVLSLAAVACWGVVGRTLRPIRQIVAEADCVNAETLAAGLLPPPATSDSEVEDLVSTLNRMTVRLHKAFEAQKRYAEAQRRFAADASHELRTPLTIMRGEVDYTLMRPREDEEYRKTLEDMVGNLDHLAGIVESLTLLARFDSTTIGVPTDTKPVDIAGLVAGLAEELRPLAVNKQIDVRVTADGPIFVKADEGQIRLAVRNLLDNALKYTPEHGTVRVSIDAGTTGDAVVSVDDSGAGISPEDLPHIFDRFWRADRSRSAEGTGLGLAIAAQIARVHGGSLTAESVVGVGSTFRFSLPIDTPDHGSSQIDLGSSIP